MIIKNIPSDKKIFDHQEISKVYNAVKFVTDNGEILWLSMRDSGFELQYNDDLIVLNEGEISIKSNRERIIDELDKD